MTYNPNNGTGSNKPYSVQSIPDGGRTYFYDEEWDKWRPYLNTDEILSYLDTSAKRNGQPFLVVNTGGVEFEGVITGGTNEIWYFKDGTEDEDLVLLANDAVAIVISKLIADKTPIPVSEGDLSIDWINGVVPGDPLNRTYFERFGNIVQGVIGMQELTATTQSKYEPSDIIVTKIAGNITQVDLYTLLDGTISIF